jgi:hypothetical protein
MDQTKAQESASVRLTEFPGPWRVEGQFLEDAEGATILDLCSGQLSYNQGRILGRLIAEAMEPVFRIDREPLIAAIEERIRAESA